MNRTIVTMASFILVATISTKVAHCGEQSQQPHHWVRTLEEVQDQVGHGIEAAHIYLPKLLSTIAYELGATEANILIEPRNVRAIIVFTISGGDGSALRRVLGLGVLTPIEEKIAKGALAYAEGKYADALLHLEGVDARDVDASLAGRVALIQAILTYKTNLKKSIELFDLTRLLATGTLVEEAAIRRQVILEAAARDREKFEMLSFQYFRRFGKSVYAEYFKQQFAISAAGLEYGDPKDGFEKLKEIVNVLDEKQRCALYVMLAEGAILMGNLPLTRFAAQNGIVASHPDTIDRARSNLYAASAGVVGDDSEAALKALQSIPTAGLNAIDGDLLRAALSVGRQVVQTLDETAIAASPSSAEDVSREVKSSSDAATDLPNEHKAAGEDDQFVKHVHMIIANADLALSDKR